MTKSPITYIEMSLIAHATEDQDKVLESAQNLLPPNCLEQITFNKNDLKGEYGNPITVFQAEIRGSQIAEGLIRNIGSNLNLLEKEILLQEFDLRLRKGNLYLRLDKQAAFKGKYILGRADSIRLQIKFETSKIEEIKKTCQEMGILP